VLLLAAVAQAADWPTFGHDPQRSGWAAEETTLSAANVSKLGLQWKAKLDNKFYRLSALTAPVVAGGISTGKGVRSVVYVAGITGTVFALDAETGAQLWTHIFTSIVFPGKGGYQGTFLCPNGITATPVIDKATNTLFVIAPDGSLFGLDSRQRRRLLWSSAVRCAIFEELEPQSRRWGPIYSTCARLRQRPFRFLFDRYSGPASPGDSSVAPLEHEHSWYMGPGRSDHRNERNGVWLNSRWKV